MILQDLDKHIEDTLAIVKYKGNFIKVFPNGSYRDDEHGAGDFPCYALERLNILLNPGKSSAHRHYYAESAATQDITDLFGAGIQGPQSYIKKNYPTCVDVFYQIDILSPDPVEVDKLYGILLEVIPYGYSPQIGSRYVSFIYQPAVNLSDLEAPLARIAQRYIVTDVYVDRLTSETVQPITTIDLQQTFNDEDIHRIR